jgi:hypothetical protein
MTKTRKVAHAVSHSTNRGGMIFNDRLHDDRRSLKVWGWTRQDYILAKGMLESLGCQVEIKEFSSRSFMRRGHYTQFRLHVKE